MCTDEYQHPERATTPISTPAIATSVIVTVDRIRIQSNSDAALFLLLHAKATLYITSTVTSKITDPKVVEPYPLDLIMHGAQALAGTLARFSIPVDIPNVPPDPLRAVLNKDETSSCTRAQELHRSSFSRSIAEQTAGSHGFVFGSLLMLTHLQGEHVIDGDRQVLFRSR